MLLLATWAMASATSQQSAACTRLADQFKQNEVAYAISRKADDAILDAAQAAGDYPGAERAQATVRHTDSTFKAEGDRIFNVMVALKCELPDHLTSHLTYRDQLGQPKAPAASSTSHDHD